MSVSRYGVIVFATVLAACAGGAPPGPAPAPSPDVAQAQDRQVVEEASMQMKVDELDSVRAQVEALVAVMAGRIENSRTEGESWVHYDLRIPAENLHGTLDGLRGLGEVENENVRTTDVTNELVDLAARRDNLIAVRDRLRGYLDRMETLEDVMAVERQLVSVQTEIDSLTARLERLRGRVAMSSIDLRIDRRRALGPLALVGSGTAWFFKKLVFLD